MIKDIQLLKNYNKIWKKIEKLMKIDFNTKTTYGDDDDKYIKTKIKTYKDSITTNFYNKNGSKKIPEEKVPHKCLSIIILDSVIYAYEKYYPQTFLEECKYVKTNVRTKNYTDEELMRNLILIVIVIMILILILILKNKFEIINNNNNK